LVFLIIGGLNWGLVGLGGFLGMNLNVVNLVFGRAPSIEWIVYLVVGVSAIVSLFNCRCASCKTTSGMGEN